MKAVLSSAVFGAAVLVQTAAARSIAAHAHAHAHVHKRAPATPAAPVAAPVEKSSVPGLNEADASRLQSLGILAGKNVPNGTANAAVAIGDNGPFVVDFINESKDDLIVVCWSGSGEAGAIDATFVGQAKPDITLSLPANTTGTASYNPALNGGSVSGACSALYPNTTLTPFSGQLDNTWQEFTYVSDSAFSTTDITRLVNMNGNPMAVANYASKEDHEPACVSNMERCSFVCPEGASTCMVGTIQNCAAGTVNTDSDASAMDGGCTGLSGDGGYVKLTFT